MSSCIGNAIMVLAFIVALLVSGVPVYATEGGGSHYPGGNEDFMAGALPPPGNYSLLYYMNYSADKIVGKNGDEIPINFDLDVNALVYRHVYVSPLKLFGASVAWHVIIPFVDQDVKIGALGVDKSSSGVGDIEFSALILGWHFNKNMHLIAALDIMAPTGHYNKFDASSIGRNYWTYAPIIAPTYISDGGFEVSAKIQYFFNTENDDTNYKSGQEFLVDYLVGQHVGNWNFGVNGFIYKQTTEDEQYGKTVPANPFSDAGNKGQTISIGPAIQYNYKNMFFNLKYQWDTNVENKPEGQKFWARFMYAF